MSSRDTGDPLADVMERMFAAFESHLALTTIARVVRHCHRDLDAISDRPLPEQLDQLAHKRLSALLPP